MRLLLLSLLGCSCVLSIDPGRATAEAFHSLFILRNNVLEAKIVIEDSVLKPPHFKNLISGQRLPSPAYIFQAAGGTTLEAADFQVGTAEIERLEAENVSRLSGSFNGWVLSVSLDGLDFIGRWSAELRDGSNYVKIALKLQRRMNSHFRLSSICLLGGSLEGGRVAGKVDGVPVVSNDFFVALEHPRASNSMSEGTYSCCLGWGNATNPDSEASLTLGVVLHGQVRRSFLHYLERERAHPSRRMLHYNTWYDIIGTGQQYTAAQAISRVREISNEMGKRGVVLDAFLLDDGWDDPDEGPWKPHTAFSKGLQQLSQTSERFNTSLGVWFSPFGGYHEPRQRRIMAARRAGIPVREEVRERIEARLSDCSSAPCSEGEGACNSNDQCKGSLECWQSTSDVSPPGIDLSGLKMNVCFDPGVRSAYLGLGIGEYYAHLQATLLDWMALGARLFKLDGIGNPAGQAETLEEDFASAIKLIASLRKVRSDIFINLSTGTWPSPFWLLYSDTVWRRGHDHFFEGPPGPPRERWITYRDSMVFQNVVMESPLFPLNSLMTHGVIFARDAWDLAVEGHDGVPSFRHEIRSAFGSGATLQELYITPQLLRSGDWDDLAEAARWAASRTEVLRDVRWVGGDPKLGEVYGWAAVEGAQAILTLRNPTASPQVIDLEAANVFELPTSGSSDVILLNSPYFDQRPRRLVLTQGKTLPLRMPPYAVLVFDSEAPPPSAVTFYVDIFFENSAIILWTVFALGATWLLRGSKPASAPPVEELRKLRLKALDRSGCGGPGLFE